MTTIQTIENNWRVSRIFITFYFRKRITHLKIIVIFTYNLKTKKMKANVKELMMNAKAALVMGNKAVASDNLNRGIIVLSRLTQEGAVNTEGATVDRWKERFWFELEVNDLIED